jgi:hypothetical protein
LAGSEIRRDLPVQVRRTGRTADPVRQSFDHLVSAFHYPERMDGKELRRKNHPNFIVTQDQLSV